MKAKNLLLSAVLLSTVNPANAALVSRDLYTTGDGLITYDSTSNLEWLDLTQTLNMSYNQVQQELLPGGTLAGWAYASMEQVRQLFDNSGGDGGYRTNNYAQTTRYLALAQTIVSLWGATYADSHSLQSRFITGDLLFIPNYTSWGSIGYTTNNSESWVQTFASASSMDSRDLYEGNALVRIATPIPSTIFLFGSSLIGLVIRRRKAT